VVEKSLGDHRRLMLLAAIARCNPFFPLSNTG
jgi:hypothetical protein